LEKTVRENINRFNSNKKEVNNVNKLPDYPRVHTNDRHVVIAYEDGTQELWAEYNSSEEASVIAEELGASLRVIKYVSASLEENVSDIRAFLESKGINNDVIDDAVAEGLYGLSVQYFKRYWSKSMIGVEEARGGSKNGSLDHLFEFAVILRERENYFRDKREAVETLLKGKFDIK
jgi:hypothetical protein